MDDATVIALELAAEFDEFAIDGSLPSLGDIFHGFERLVEVVAQLDVNDPCNWVVDPAKVAALAK
jgi:hypothetical protein